MIPEFVVNEIRRLLAEGKLSYRKIGKVAGVSRGSVSGIASGKRPDYKSLSRATAPVEDEAFLHRPYQHCGGCGHKVQMPCLRCSLVLHGRKGTNHDGDYPAKIAPELEGDDALRYEEIRARMVPSPGHGARGTYAESAARRSRRGNGRQAWIMT